MAKLWGLVWSLVLATPVWADPPAIIPTPLEVTEEDGGPSTYPYQVKFTNGTVTDNGDGTTSISTSAGNAPDSADYLVGTTNASLSAEIVVGTTPGGELGNTWASPTIDDSLAVTSWNLTTPTITTSATLTDGATVGQAAGPLLTFDDTNNELELTGAELGIGSSTPSAPLYVLPASGTAAVLIEQTGSAVDLTMRAYSSTNDFDSPRIFLERARGTLAAPTSVSANDYLFQLSGGGYFTGGFRASKGRIEMLADGTWGTNDFPTRITFSTTADGTNTTSEWFRIENGGEIGIGTTAPDAALEINSATGDNLQLTYNDANGSAANYATFQVSSSGDLTIAPSGSDTSVTGRLASTATSVTIAAAATTFAVASNVVTVTGDALGNVVATITGGMSGQVLTLLFVDALVTITDTAAATANTVNLSAAFVSTADDTITLVHNGNKWFETARSLN